MNPLWPHQQYAIDEVLASIQRGERRICLTSPTGGGKTRIICELVEKWAEEGMKVVVYSNRKMLVEQTSRVMEHAGIDHGMRAAGYSDEGKFEPVQVSSLQTEDARVFKSGRWQLHDAQRIVVDECHVQKGPLARKILDAHYEEGATILGVTATPLEIGGIYSHLIQAGTTSELRACGALVLAEHYAPDEPDLRGVKVPLGEDLTEKQNVKAIMREGIFGRVLDHYKRLNPEQKPTILFAPGVRESLWFMEKFNEAGISAAHIDGQEVRFNGEVKRTGKKVRQEVLEASRAGSLRVLCNRFVLREGIDAPWLAHGILATVFGSLQSYMQAGGRLLRSHAALDHVSIQDHGGNWWRHGSLNADRQWSLGLTSSTIAAMREDDFREKRKGEPLICPRCTLVLMFPKCRRCGWEPAKGWRKSRPVIEQDGMLKIVTGDVFRRRAVDRRPQGPEIWKRMYFRSKTDKGQRTFRAAAALYAAENNWQWPDRSWKYMPTNDHDWHRNVSEVPMERLR